MKNSNYTIEYCDDKVSAWGGFSVMQQFNQKMHLREFIKSLPIPQSTSNNRYEVEDIVESFLLSVWLGCYKFSHTHVLRLDDTLKQIFGWKQIPSDTSYKRFFKKSSFPNLSQKEEELPIGDLEAQLKLPLVTLL